jgi:hypothetical protein
MILWSSHDELESRGNTYSLISSLAILKLVWASGCDQVSKGDLAAISAWLSAGPWTMWPTHTHFPDSMNCGVFMLSSLSLVDFAPLTDSSLYSLCLPVNII